MRTMTIDELLKILTESAGHGEALETTDDPADRAFDDLGYDSLALLETAAHIEQEFGVELPDDEVSDLKTPRAFLDLVNGAMAEAS